MRQNIEFEPGALWGYRARARDDLTCVKVLRIGTKRPPRIKIRFLDDEYEGREDWVPPSRLKIRWVDRERFFAAQQRWQAVEDASAEAVDTFEAKTCILAFERLLALLYVDWRSADRYAVLRTKDLVSFKVETGLKYEDLLAYPAAYSEDDQIVAPWPALRVAAQALAHVEPEICIEVDREYAPQWELLRTWCGAEIQARRDELAELRGEVVRLSGLVEAAITELDKAGSRRAARRLEGELGVP